MPKSRVRKRRSSPDTRGQIGLSLSHAFPVGDGGSFTSLLQAIDDATD